MYIFLEDDLMVGLKVVDLANGQLLGLGWKQINIHGVAMSLGHRIGASKIVFETQIITKFKHVHYWKQVHFAIEKDLRPNQLDNMIQTLATWWYCFYLLLNILAFFTWRPDHGTWWQPTLCHEISSRRTGSGNFQGPMHNFYLQRLTFHDWQVG